MLTKNTVKNKIDSIDIYNPKFGKTLSARIASLPGIKTNLSENSIVYTGYENNRIDSPIIIGLQNNDLLSDMHTSDLEVLHKASIKSINSVDNKITNSEIACLKGLSTNLQSDIDNINNDYINDTQISIEKQHKNINEQTAKLNRLKLDIDSLDNSLVEVDKILGSNDSTDQSTIYGLYNGLITNLDSLGNLIGEDLQDEPMSLVKRIQILDKNIDDLSKKIDKKLIENANQSDNANIVIDNNVNYDVYFEYSPDKSKIDNMINYAKSIANNNMYVYGSGALRDFGTREINGKKYKCLDCATFVWYCVKAAGWPIDKFTTAYAFGVNDLDKILRQKLGWKRFNNASNIRAGDILWGESHYNHTEIAISDHERIGAHYHDSSNPSQDISIRSNLNFGSGVKQFSCYFRPPEK